MKVESIPFLLKQIHSCLDKGENVAAFYMALTLPDVCGKIDFPEDKPSERYIKWFDLHIGDYEQSPLAKEDEEWAKLPYMNGNNLYKIRCGLLHAGTNDFGDQLNLNDFLFSWDGAIETAGIESDGNGNVKKYWRVDTRMLTNKIVWTVEGLIRKGFYKDKEMPVFNEYGIDDIPDVYKVK